MEKESRMRKCQIDIVRAKGTNFMLSNKIINELEEQHDIARSFHANYWKRAS